MGRLCFFKEKRMLNHCERENKILLNHCDRETKIWLATRWFDRLCYNLCDVTDKAMSTRIRQKCSDAELEEYLLKLINRNDDYKPDKQNLCRNILVDGFHLGHAPKDSNHILVTCTLQMNEWTETLCFWFDLDIIASHLNHHYNIEPPHHFKAPYLPPSGTEAIYEKNDLGIQRHTIINITFEVKPTWNNLCYSFFNMCRSNTENTVHELTIPPIRSMAEAFNNAFTSIQERDELYVKNKQLLQRSSTTFG